MKQLAIISGKGGTGKTLLSASFATLAKNQVLVDCDVDAANLHLLLPPDIQNSHSFSAGKKARVLKEKCTQCKECIQVCRFDAIAEFQTEEILIDRMICEGCGVCSQICPAEAIQMEEVRSGFWFLSRTSFGPMVHARLGIGEENSGKLVTEIRNAAEKIAYAEDLDLIIIDGPPGIGCPVIASLSRVDLAVVVTEPTLSGIHDMERIIQTAQHFKTQVACCINKYDINPQHTAHIETWCQEQAIPVLGKIPFDVRIIEAIGRALPPTLYFKNHTTEEIERTWANIIKLMHLEV